MMFGIYLIIVFLKMALTEGKLKYVDNAETPLWTYDNEDEWPGFRCKSGGRRQSPIDIRTDQVVRDDARRFIRYGPLKFAGYKRVLVTGINNGHTVQFSSEGEEAMHPTLEGGPLKDKYRLEQIHFHWLSEHSINGFKYPMEIHFVHVRADLTVQEALSNSEGLAIVSVFCNVQAELEQYQLDAHEVIEHIPKLLHVGDRISGVLLDMTKLMSPNINAYYAYAGSLTSPECNEVVTWIIFEEPIFLSDAQYRIFGKIGVGRHNFRRLQKVKHHIVYSPGGREKPRPSHGVIKSFFTAVTEFIKNLGSVMGKKKKKN